MFLLRKHFVINKNVSIDGFDRMLTNNEWCPTQRHFRHRRYTYNNWCIALLCTSFRRNWGSKLLQDHWAWRHHFICWRYIQGLNSARWDSSRHIQTLAWPLKFLISNLFKRISDNKGPIRTGIGVLKNGMCSLTCSELWIHNRFKNIVNVTLPCQRLSNNLEIELVVMTKAAPHHNGRAINHISLNNNVILKKDPVDVDDSDEHAHQ